VIIGQRQRDLPPLESQLLFNDIQELDRENATNTWCYDPHFSGRGTGPVVYVESQGLFYDSIVLADLPAKGRFQQLKPGEGPSGLATEFGPGDTGYLGGRWWIDANGNNYMDDGDAFFLCPLLGPGRSVL
jgi:hypothetical protein